MKKIILISLIIMGVAIAPIQVLATANTFFEITGADTRGNIFGGNSGTVTDYIAQKYVSPGNQTLCKVYQLVSRVNASLTIPSLELNIRQGGGNPEAGVEIASVRVPAKDLPTLTGIEVPFVLPNCVPLTAGTTYWFMFKNYSPINTLSFGNYLSQYRPSNQFSYSSFWFKSCSACIPNFVWVENTSREWSLRLEGPDLAPHEPVIIVPGILGTRLNRVSDGQEVWPNGTRVAISPSDDFLDELSLDIGGNQIINNEMNPTEIILTSDFLGFHSNVYANLVKGFGDIGYATGTDLFTVPYDWRLDLASSTSRLDSVIKTAIAKSPTGKVNIIAHSMGGLLTKEYLRQASSTSFVDKLILAGVPELGSPKAFKALQYGDDFDIKKFGLGLNSKEIKKIGQNMPSVYQLLPSRQYIDSVGRYIADYRNIPGILLDYFQTNSLMLENPNDSRNQTLIDRADDFHKILDGSGFKVPPDSIYRLVGCQNPKTIGYVRHYDNNNDDFDPIDGDGTVPLGSATYSSEITKNYYALFSMTGINHTGLIRDERAINLIKDIFNSTSTISLPNGISSDRSDCNIIPENAPNKNTLIFSTHSPVILHIYDSQGRHTGPDANGDIELGISNSDYEQIGENSFVWVPANDTYKVVMQATDSGAFDLKAKIYSGVQLTGVDTYLAVPLASSSTIATATFSNLSVPPVLDLDSNGDGAVDTTVIASAVLVGTDANDIIPPTISIDSPKTQVYARSLPISLDINFTDNQSGIASSSITLDGILIAGSSTIDQALLTVGDHKFNVVVHDRAGNLAEASISFQVAITKDSIRADIDKQESLNQIRTEEVAENFKQHLETLSISDFLTFLRNQHNHCNLSDSAYQIIKNDIELIINL